MTLTEDYGLNNWQSVRAGLTRQPDLADPEAKPTPTESSNL
ncbi:hypothetical protein [Leptothermofonsia sichuanensis]|nr:hypothetical protein [Leptothermofonsia sichuanensis]